MHVIYALEHGGTERFLHKLLNALAHDPVRHVLCTLREPGARAARLDPRIEVIALRLRGRDRFGFVKLARAIRGCGADLVHARNPGTWGDALLACKFARRAQPILSFHGLLDANGFEPRMRRRLRFMNAHHQPFTTVSNSAKRTLIDTLDCTEGRVQVLSNGVDLDVFHPLSARVRQDVRAQLGLVDDALVIANVANFFSPVKGHAVLIDAFARVAHRDPRARLMLFGFGPLRDAMVQRVAERGLSERVSFPGAVENTADVLGACDLYVCPSLSEGMSNALLEAMACALPCVATDVADHPRIVGVLPAAPELPPAGDADTLARAICILMENPERRIGLARQCRQRVETEFDLRGAFERYRAFYADMLASKNEAKASVQRREDSIVCAP